MKEKMKEKKIIFFDGVCGLCNGFVDFLIKKNNPANPSSGTNPSSDANPDRDTTNGANPSSGANPPHDAGLSSRSSNTRNESFYFSPLQGELSEKLLDQKLTQDLQSIVYWRYGEVYQQSTAAIKILQDIKGVWGLCAVFLLVPLFIRENLYRWVAKNRYRWFGKKETCRVPSPEEKTFFLE